jgi:2-deoxy-D-gluconate 3-dehydrogenase
VLVRRIVPNENTSERSTLDLFRLTGRAALVTGGAGLLGAQFCRTLAQAGAQVVIADLNHQAGEDLAGSLTREGYSVIAVQADVTDPGSVRNMVAATLEAFGRLDILVNSAALDPKFDPQHGEDGFGPVQAPESFPLAAWEQYISQAAGLSCLGGVGYAGWQGRDYQPRQSMAWQTGSTYLSTARPGPKYKPVYYSVTKAPFWA